MSIWVYGMYVFIPLIVSNVLHMLVVKKACFAGLALPVSANLFGSNKTWRGLLLVPLLNAFFFTGLNVFLSAFSWGASLGYGFLLGLAYVLFELPNSFLKRQLGIPPGARPQRHAFWFAVLDKSDSAFGVVLLSAFLFGFGIQQFLVLFLTAVAVHAFFSGLLVLLGIKKNF